MPTLAPVAGTVRTEFAMLPLPNCSQLWNVPKPPISDFAVMATGLLLVVVETVVEGGPDHAPAGVTDAMGVSAMTASWLSEKAYVDTPLPPVPPPPCGKYQAVTWKVDVSDGAVKLNVGVVRTSVVMFQNAKTYEGCGVPWPKTCK